MLSCGLKGLAAWCFFFQAEDGIRDLYVTGVQTCALPIWPSQAHSGCTQNPTTATVQGVIGGVRTGQILVTPTLDWTRLTLGLLPDHEISCDTHGALMDWVNVAPRPGSGALAGRRGTRHPLPS